MSNPCLSEEQCYLTVKADWNGSGVGFGAEFRARMLVYTTINCLHLCLS